MSTLTTLGLKLPTDPRWVNIAQMNLHDILIDHAFCEQKAASSCISLIVRYPDREKLVEVLTPVVAEEWGHFQRVLKELRKRGLKLTHKRKDEYVEKLLNYLTKTGDNEVRLMEQLLICALIEARSAERFKLLSEQLADENLKKFYHELMISEAIHYRNFIELAEEYMPKATVWQRWQQLLEQEAEIMKTLEVRSDRFH